MEKNTHRSIFIQKQPLRGVPRKRFSENIQQIYRRTPMPKSDFNKVALGCSSVNLLRTFRTSFLKNTSGGCFCLYLKLSLALSSLDFFDIDHKS